MIVNVEIQGGGTVTGAGEYQPGTPVTVTYNPKDGFSFKHFDISGKIIKSNPCIFMAGDVDVTVIADSYVSIECYLQSKISYDISKYLQGIRLDRNLLNGADVNDVSDMVKELCLADLYMVLARTLPSSVSAGKDSDGGWSHQDDGFSISNAGRQQLIADALTIYTRHNDPKAEEIKTSNENKAIMISYSYVKPPIKVKINHNRI